MWRGLKPEQLHIQRITMQATRAGLFFSWCLMQFSRVDYSIYIQDAFENSTSLSSVFYNPRPLTPPPCPPNTQSVLSKAEKKETERETGVKYKETPSSYQHYRFWSLFIVQYIVEGIYKYTHAPINRREIERAVSAFIGPWMTYESVVCGRGFSRIGSYSWNWWFSRFDPSQICRTRQMQSVCYNHHRKHFFLDLQLYKSQRGEMFSWTSLTI